MMLRFQWDSLRRGDHLLAHDVRTSGRAPSPSVVVPVDFTRPGRDADLAASWHCDEAAAA